MAKGYWIIDLDVHDADQYAKYVAEVRPYLERAGGTFIVRGGENDVTEGSFRSRVVVIEFASFEAAKSAYNSSEYNDIKALRLEASTANAVVIEGL